MVGLTNEVYVYNNTLVNLERGLAERVFNVERDGAFGPPPIARDGAFLNLAEFANSIVKLVGVTTRITYDQFVASYTGRKATIYANAVSSLYIKPIRRQDAYMSTFVKAEKVVPSLGKEWPACRIIQPRSSRYNVEVGRYLKRLEKPLCAAIDELWGGIGGEPVVMKGLTVEKTASVLRTKFDKYHNPVAVGLDAIRFDQHVSIQALKWEHEVYARCFPGDERSFLRKLLKWQLVNKGWARAHDGVIKYTVNGCRMSGDMNTSMGNCLLMCGLVHEYARQRGIKLDLANNGDDCVVIMEQEDVNSFCEGLKEWFVDYGFSMKVESPVTEFEHIEFCRMRPVRCADGWVMVRRVSESIIRDLTTVLSVPGVVQARKWLGAVGLGGQSLTYGVPIVNHLYKMMTHVGLKSKMAESPWMADQGFMRLGTNRKEVPITPEARYSFWRAFGVTPDAQVAMENSMDLRCEVAPNVTSLAGITYNTICNIPHTRITCNG